MFLHGGWLHLIGNMLYLWIFGDNVEDRVGHVRFVVLYFAGGIAAALAQVYIAPDARIPMVGASGAIAAVLGAYLVLYPHARVYTLIPLLFGIIAVPAVLYLGFWFVLQLISGVSSIGASQQGGVAFFAHVGGFVSGIVLVKVLDRGPASLPPHVPMRRWA
jgi:membrane associated rhomboid family serine protease